MKFVQKVKVVYIGVPIAQGADREGVEKTPDIFREYGIVDMISNISGCHDLGNINSSIIDEDKYCANQEVKYLNTVVDVTSQLRDKVVSVIRQGYFPLIVGGDHSLAMGSGAGSAMTEDNLGVIWFDAHGDFNTEATSPTGNLHGIPCAALMGWCESPLNDVAKTHIPPENFFWIGTRDLDEGEVQMMNEHKLQVFSSSCVKERGMNAIMDEIIHRMNNLNIKKIHISIDIDAMDPTIICGTGTRVDNGMWNGDFYTFLDRIFDTKRVQSVDFVEYNSKLDDSNFTSAKWCVEALHYLALKIKDI